MAKYYLACDASDNVLWTSTPVSEERLVATRASFGDPFNIIAWYPSYSGSGRYWTVIESTTDVISRET